MLGRGLLENNPTPSASKRKANTVGGGAKGHGAGAGTDGTLPVHLQAQMLSLLAQLLRSGRRLTPRTPALLEEEFSLLAPDVVRLAVAAAKAASTAVARGLSDEIAGKSGVARGGSGGGSGGGGRGGGTGDGGATAATPSDVFVRAVALLEELQMGDIPAKRLSADGDDSDDDGAALGRDEEDRLAGGGRVGMRLRPEEALALSEAADAMAELGLTSSPSFDGRTLKTRVVALLASPGAVEASATAASLATKREHQNHGDLHTWARATAHGESRTKDLKSSSTSRSTNCDATKHSRAVAREAPVLVGNANVPTSVLPQQTSPRSKDSTSKSSRKRRKSRVE